MEDKRAFVYANLESNGTRRPDNAKAIELEPTYPNWWISAGPSSTASLGNGTSGSDHEKAIGLDPTMDALEERIVVYVKL